jgi:hypothetical protein
MTVHRDCVWKPTDRQGDREIGLQNCTGEIGRKEVRKGRSKPGDLAASR